MGRTGLCVRNVNELGEDSPDSPKDIMAAAPGNLEEVGSHPMLWSDRCFRRIDAYGWVLLFLVHSCDDFFDFINLIITLLEPLLHDIAGSAFVHFANGA